MVSWPPEVSYLSPTCVMQPASQRNATQHELRSSVHTAARRTRGQKTRTVTEVSQCQVLFSFFFFFLLQSTMGTRSVLSARNDRKTTCANIINNDGKNYSALLFYLRKIKISRRFLSRYKVHLPEWSFDTSVSSWHLLGYTDRIAFNFASRSTL